MKYGLYVLAILMLSACSAYKHVTPISNTFLQDVDVTKKMENMPFEHSWVWVQDIDRSKFKSIYVAP